MTRDFFDPTPEQQNVTLIDAAILRDAETLIESCWPPYLLSISLQKYGINGTPWVAIASNRCNELQIYLQLSPNLRKPLNLVFILLVFCCSTYAQDRAIDWRIDPGTGVTAEDRQAIIKLVKETGIEEPGRISVVYLLPSGGKRLKVESRVTIDGMHRAWLELSVCRTDWKPLYCSPKHTRVKRVGRWQAGKAI